MVFYSSLMIIGIVGTVIGVISLCYNILISKKRSWFIAIVFGIFIAAGSVYGRGFLRYPVPEQDTRISGTNSPGGMPYIIGIPFFVSFRDADGMGQGNPFPQPGLIANALFWFLVPQIILTIAQRAQKKS